MATPFSQRAHTPSTVLWLDLFVAATCVGVLIWLVAAPAHPSDDLVNVLTGSVTALAVVGLGWFGGRALLACWSSAANALQSSTSDRPSSAEVPPTRPANTAVVLPFHAKTVPHVRPVASAGRPTPVRSNGGSATENAHASDDFGDFATSMLVSEATGSVLMGAAVGGSLTGALVGDLVADELNCDQDASPSNEEPCDAGGNASSGDDCSSGCDDPSGSSDW